MRNLKLLFESVQIIENTSQVEQPELESKVIIDSGLHFDNDMKKISQQFLDFYADQKGLKEYPKVHILAKRHEGMTYGAYDPNTDEILVYGKDRGLADMLRTAAHELTHFVQKIEGRIPKNLQSRDHKLESEANTVAGDMIYMFGLKEPKVYELGAKESNTKEVPVN